MLPVTPLPESKVRYAIVSDIHANLQAWQATLADIQQVGVHQIICLGDVVGYGPNPQEVYESVREVADGCILGNHDAVVCNRLDPIAFNPNARRIIEWTADQLSDDAKLWFADVPMLIESTNFECSHAEFEIPERFRYIFSAQDAGPSFDASSKPLLFVGHTHRQAVFVKEGDQPPRQLPANNFDCMDGCRYLVNVGSVGDPRNGEVAGSYAILDVEDGSVEFRNVEFDVFAYRDAIVKSGLSTRPMLFNFVSGAGFGEQADKPDDTKNEFNPSDNVLAKAPESAPNKATASSTPATSEKKIAASKPKANDGEADVETIARGAALLLIPLVLVGALLIATRDDNPSNQTATSEPPPVTAPIEPTPQTDPQPEPVGDPDKTTAPANDETTPPETKPAPETVPVPEQPGSLRWPEPDKKFPGRNFRLGKQFPDDSLPAVAEAVVAGSVTLAQERANAYLANRKDLADTEEYQALFDDAVAAAAWQQTLAKSYESAIGKTASIRTWQGERRIQIKSVATNGLNVRTVLENGEIADVFIPFDDLPDDDERRRRLAHEQPRIAKLMHGISSFRAGLADQAAGNFSEAGGLLASGMQELLNANRKALRPRTAYRALTILYRMIDANAEKPPEELASAMLKRQFTVRELAALRRAVDTFRERFGDTATGEVAEPLLNAIDQVRPRYFTPLLQDPAHAFSLAAESIVESPNDASKRVIADQADPKRFAAVAPDASSTDSAVGPVVVLTRQSDCPSAPLSPTLAGNPAVTVAFWAKAPESNASRTVASFGPEGAASDRLAVVYNKTYGVTIGDNQWDTGVPVRNELWQYHVVTRGEGGSLTWWLFDQKVAQGRIAGDLNLSGSVLIGANLGGLNGSRRVDVFRGLLKDLHVYPRILLDDEIRRLGREARTFSVAARLDNRLGGTTAQELPEKPAFAFTPKAVSEAKFVMQAKGLIWQNRSDFPVGTVVGDSAIAGGIAPKAKSFRTVAFVPEGQKDLAGCVFRIRTIPGGIVAESQLVTPGSAVLFDLPLKATTGKLQLETVLIGTQEAQAHWLQPGFYR
jgi:predicted phosphodiesterase